MSKKKVDYRANIDERVKQFRLDEREAERLRDKGHPVESIWLDDSNSYFTQDNEWRFEIHFSGIRYRNNENKQPKFYGTQTYSTPQRALTAAYMWLQKHNQHYWRLDRPPIHLTDVEFTVLTNSLGG